MGVGGDDCGLERIEEEEEDSGGRKPSMDMAPERSKQLHNFTLPRTLNWGNQRLLRCRKVGLNGEIDRRSSGAAPEVYGSSIEGDQRREVTETDRLTDRTGESFPAPLQTTGALNRSSSSDRDGGIEAVRTKLMFDLQTAADKMKDAIFKEGTMEKSRLVAVSNAVQVVAAAPAVRPWNLRTRRAACKAPSGGWVGGAVENGLKVDIAPRPNAFPTKAEKSKSPVPSVAAIASSSPEKSKNVGFSLSLSKRDIEEDFIAITGRRPPRRPKKRPRTIQREIDYLFPGTFFTEVTADTYKVHDPSDSGKLMR